MYEAGSPPSSPPIPLSFTQDMYYGDDEDPDITIHTTPPSFTYRWDPTYKNISSSTNRTFVFTNWPGLLTCISTLLLQPCNYSGPFYSGSRNILRRIVSGDGKNWIVRIPTIPDGCRDPNSKDWWTKERRTAFESEIATLRWVRENTPIPVPEVEGYCPVAEGKAEMPWMLLTALKGHCIKDILDSRSRPLDSQETHRIMNAVAWVQVTLFHTALLPEIGSIHLSPSNDLELGPLPGIFAYQTGSFTTTAAYLQAWCLASSARAPAISPEYTSFPSNLLRLLPYIVPLTEPTMFPLVRGEFLNRNLLFDDELRIVGLVDWESAAAAPAEAFAARTCMYRGWDGAVEGGYKVEVEAVEGGRKDLGRVLGGVLGELAVAMWVHEMGVDGIGYTEVLERAKGSRVRFGGGEGVDVVLGGGEMEGL